MTKQPLPQEAQDLIKALKLEPHPEGGWYRQTFRDSDGETRGASTAIYYLLAKGEKSHWHRVHDAAEVWHYYKGAPLQLSIAKEGETAKAYVLGPDIANGEEPQLIVPANDWQAARSLGDYTLVGCTVAPGFEFSSFEMAAPDWQPSKM